MQHNSRAFVPYGERSLLVRVHPGEIAASYAELILQNFATDVDIALPTEKSVLVRFKSRRNMSEITKSLLDLEPSYMFDSGNGKLIQISVDYSGDDLSEVLDLLTLSKEQFINWHTAQDWRVAFVGFSAGFSYLTCAEPLQLPRKSSPRASVPSGSVSMANHYCAVYPKTQPSGWQMIGHTDHELWDSKAKPPIILLPGSTVRFVATVNKILVTQPKKLIEPDVVPPVSNLAIQVLNSHQGVTVQDRGRNNLEIYGVSPAGAFDRIAADSANLLVGNAPEAPLLEITAGAFSMRAKTDVVLALTGASGSASIQSSAGLVPAPYGAAFLLLAEEVLSIAPFQNGLRGYLAVRGGIASNQELGSAATDTLGSLGPAPIPKDSYLSIGDQHNCTLVSTNSYKSFEITYPAVLQIQSGPHIEMVGQDALIDLLDRQWAVSSTSNRIAVRLAGDPVRRKETAEMNSEGIIFGAIQLPPSGQPLIFGVDHPTTGGYPVIAVMRERCRSLLAQLRPGDKIKFKLVEDTRK